MRLRTRHVLAVSLQTFLMHFMARGSQVRTWKSPCFGMQCVFARSVGRQWWAASEADGKGQAGEPLLHVYAIEMAPEHGGPRKGGGIMTRSLAGHGFLAIKQRVGVSQS